MAAVWRTAPVANKTEVRTHVRKSPRRMLCGIPVEYKGSHGAAVTPLLAPDGEPPTCIQCLKYMSRPEQIKRKVRNAENRHPAFEAEFRAVCLRYGVQAFTCYGAYDGGMGFISQVATLSQLQILINMAQRALPRIIRNMDNLVEADLSKELDDDADTEQANDGAA